MFSEVDVPMFIVAMLMVLSLLGILGFLILSSLSTPFPKEKKKEENFGRRIEFPMCPLCGGNSSITISHNGVIATCVLCNHKWAQQGQEVNCLCDSCLPLPAA